MSFPTNPTLARPSLERCLPQWLIAVVPRPAHLALVALALDFLLTPLALRAMNHGLPPEDLRAFAITEADGPSPGAFVPNFRLTDHTGTTRELYYDSTAKAVVLVFTSQNSPRALQTAAALKALRARFAASEVVIWQIDSNLGATRAVAAAEQALHDNPTPVLLDDAQIVAAELGATRQLETFVIAAPAWQLVYRGPLDNAPPNSLAAPTENHAADAVAAVVAGRTPARTQVDFAASTPPLDLPPTPAVSFAADVAPILTRRCVECHSAGNIAPFTFSRYDDVQAKAASIRANLLTKRMAPWHADSQFGVWANNVALSTAEVATLHAWVRAGAPRGTGPDPLESAPPPPGGDWPLGPPDAIVSIPLQSLPATGAIAYRYETVSVPGAAGQWLRAVVVKPGNSRVVHHALVFEGTLLDVLVAEGGLGGFFAGYVPGMRQTWFPESTGKRMRGNLVTLQMHYTATGQPETDQTQVGFYFANTPPERELLTKAAMTTNITIPAHAREYEREATFMPSATRDVLLYEFSPHMHYRGKRMKFEAMYPNGTREVLLSVPHYDFAWQSLYRLAEPKRLPAGTTIRLTGAFDNSAQNRANPNPGAIVRFGEQTDDEMFVGYVNYAELSARAAVAPPVFAANLTARARVGQPFSFPIAAGNEPTSYGATPLPAGLTFANGVISGTPAAAGRHAIVVSASNAAGSAASVLDLVITAPSGAPVFTRQPQSVRARIGETVTLSAEVNAPPGVTYTWFVRGGEFCNTDTPSVTLTDVTAAHAGDWVCVASNASGSTSSAAATLSLEFTGLVNLSARANVGTGADVVIPGITVRGDKPKTLLIRAAGPALAAFGLPGALANPVVSVFDGSGRKILVNDNWGEAPNLAALRTAAAAQGAFALPEGSGDSALLVTVPPGTYTVQIEGAGSGAAAGGVAAVEVYEADASPSTLVNLSCRARVGTGGDILIAGFVLRGTQPRRVLIRAVGPTLGNLGLTGTLADPKLELYRGDTRLQENNDWGGSASLSAAFESVGAFALGATSKDAALILELPPGGYTAQVSGADGGTGIAIVEVYALP